jgi:hypothetical protein
VTTRLIESFTGIEFGPDSPGFRGMCSYENSCLCSNGGNAVATLLITDRRGRKSWRALCNHHAEKHRKDPS